MKNESSLSARVRTTLLWALPVLLVIWILAGNYIGKLIEKSIEEQDGWREPPVYFSDKPHRSDNGGWDYVGVDKYDRIWAESYSSGVAMIDGGVKTIYNTNNSGLADDSVRRFLLNPAGNPWVLTREGLSYFDGKDWVTYSINNSGIDDDSLKYAGGMAVDQDGRVWIGTSAGVSVFDGVEWVTYTTENSGLTGDMVRGIALDQDGKVWVATDDGVSVFDGVGWATYTTGNSGLLDNRVRGIALDQDGKAWIDTNDGLSVFDGVDWATYTTGNSGLIGNRMRRIAFDQDGNTWVVAIDGVSVFDGANWTGFTAKNSALVDDNVQDIVIDQEDKVWIATRDGGVSVWDGNNWITYTEKNSPLPVNSVRYLEVFSTGEILIDTYFGPTVTFSNNGQLPAPPLLVTMNDILSDYIFGSLLIISLWLVIVFGLFSQRITTSLDAIFSRFSRRIALSKRYFLPLWILATTLAWCIFIPFFWEFADRTGGGGELGFYSGGSLIQLLLLYVKIGLVIGVCQWVVLQLYIPEAGWWIVATAGGCFLGIVTSRIFGVDDGVKHLRFTYAAVGVFQWLFLRKFSSADGLDSLIWVILKPLGLLAAMIALLFTGDSLGGFGSSLAALPMGIVFGLISGLHLAALLRRQGK